MNLFDILDFVRFCSIHCKHLNEDMECMNTDCVKWHIIAYDMLLDDVPFK